MKSKLGILPFFIIGSLVFFAIPFVKCNPVPIVPYFYYQYYLLIFVPLGFILAIFIEFTVYYFVFKKFFLRIPKLLKAVIFVNFLSYPIAQTLGFLFSFLFIIFIGFYFIAELIPTLLEYLLFSRIFDEFYKNKYLRYPIPIKRTFYSVVIANLITFTLGLSIMFPYLIPFIIYA